MNVGDLLLRFALLFGLASCAFSLRELRGRGGGAQAGALFGLHTAALAAAMILLGADFLGRRFEFEYVARYSSRALSPALTLAATWAGQEGSILLWALLGGIAGLALLRQPGRLTRPAMTFVTLAQCGLLLLLMVRSPFARSPFAPPDGMGLNPLLEDPWMVVHPPVLFAGYAVLCVPFALAAAALVLGEPGEWNRAVWPWALMAVLTLGTGIVLGGIWAYKVLGWGGYWGWDPVENASLVPWLVAIALLHGLLIQRATGALARTNLLLGLLGWIAVLAGTYLTRSGILQDFSVHSFAPSGLHGPLLVVLGGTALLSTGLLVAGWRGAGSRAEAWGSLSRESALWVGLVTVLLFAAMVIFGTTVPLLTALAGRPAGIRTSFYETMSIPFGVLIALLIAISPALRWSRQAGLGWVRGLLPGIAGGLAAAAIALVTGIRSAGHLLLLGTAGFALVINAVVAARLLRRGAALGASLGHAGVSVMILGMVLSTALGRTERLSLRADTPRHALGYTLIYRGEQPDGSGGHRIGIEITSGSWRFRAEPRLLDLPGGEGSMRKPAVSLVREIYLSPLDLGGEPVGTVAVVDFSTKPLVNLVWIGAVLALLGAFLAGIRRAREIPAHERRAATAA